MFFFCKSAKLDQTLVRYSGYFQSEEKKYFNIVEPVIQ